MKTHFKFLILSILFGIVAGQAPRPNGRDSPFLTPLEPGEQSDPEAPPVPGPLPPGEAGPEAALAPEDEPEAEGPEDVETPPPPEILTPLQCRRLRFRTITGQCTSFVDSTLGEARHPHLSLFGVDSREMAGEGLPSPRLVSNIVANQVEDVRSARGLNDLSVFFGQFIDHSVVATPLSEEEEDIPVPPGDPNTEPLPFRRSVRGLVDGGPEERPINSLPSAVDLTTVYGPNAPRNIALRVENSCKLKTSAGDLLPFNTEGFFNAPNSDPEFYFAGDHRSNEHPVLTALHTLWVREHNYICDRIEETLFFLPAQKKYETARAINIAEFQKVVYDEFIPAVTGRFLRRFRGFRRRSNPTLSSVFSTAAFRVGHTQVGEVVTEISDTGVTRTTPLREFFFVPRSVDAGIDPFIRGAARTLSMEVDVMVVDSLRNFLFQSTEEEEGPDLISLNLQRSRDHNIPSFNDIRTRLGIPRATSFAGITSDPDVQQKLAAVYASVDDVEAWIGMMAEDKMVASSVGRTLFGVWEQEFLRLRDGDQFFFLRGKAIPFFARRKLRSLIAPLRRRRSRIFANIIQRNTGLSAGDLNKFDVFKA